MPEGGDGMGWAKKLAAAGVLLLGARALLSGGARVAEAAEAVGFYDAKYFTRVFKKHTGVSPARYRAEAGG